MKEQKTKHHVIRLIQNLNETFEMPKFMKKKNFIKYD